MEKRLIRILDDFSRSPMTAGKAMREMLEENGDAFLEAAIPVLKSYPDSLGFEYLLTLLVQHELILKALTDPDLLSFDDAIQVAKRLVRTEQRLITLMQKLADGSERASEGGADVRFLAILAAVITGAQTTAVMGPLLQHSNPWIRSKAALLIGRMNKNHRWVGQRLLETDNRVRANAIESLWGVETEGARAVLWEALADPDNRVVGNALLGLYRIGDVSCVPLIVDRMNADSEACQITCLWVMGETGDPRFQPYLVKKIKDPDPKVRAAAFRALGSLRKKAALRIEPRLDVLLGTPARLEEGWWSVTVSIWGNHRETGEPAPVRGLKATNLALYEEDGQLVTEYEVQEAQSSGNIGAAFVLPNDPGGARGLRRICEDALGSVLPRLQRGDAWAILKYPAAQEAADNTPSIQPPGQPGQPAPAPVEIKYLNDARAIQQAATATGPQTPGFPTALQAIKSLIPVAKQFQGLRRIVLVLQDSAGERSAWREVQMAARAARIAVYVIAFDAEPVLEELCASTGGSFELLSSAAQTPRSLDTVCATMAHSYSIRYRPPGNLPAGVALRVAVCTNESTGEQTIEGQRLAQAVAESA